MDDTAAWADALAAALEAFLARPPHPKPATRFDGFSPTVCLLHAGCFRRDLTRLCERALRHAAPVPVAPVPVAKRGRTIRSRIRVGLLYGKDFGMASGLLVRLDRSRFEPVLLRREDAEAATAPPDVAAVELSRDQVAARDTLADLGLDVLLIALTTSWAHALAQVRLAPVQALWLEPPSADATGVVDYYLSWERAEPRCWWRHYWSMPAFTTHPPYWLHRGAFACAELTRARFPVPPGARWYVCPSAPNKVRAAFDAVAIGILTRDPEGVLVLTRREQPRALLNRNRMLRRRPELASRVVVLPTLEEPVCNALLRLADAVLDSIPLGGMSSAFTAACLGVPKVTLPFDGPFGRWGASLYEHLGVPELVAHSADDCVERALRLAHEPSWRARLADRLSRAVASLDSHAGVRELERFLGDAHGNAQRGDAPRPWIAGRFVEAPVLPEASAGPEDPRA